MAKKRHPTFRQTAFAVLAVAAALGGGYCVIYDVTREVLHMDFDLWNIPEVQEVQEVVTRFPALHEGVSSGESFMFCQLVRIEDAMTYVVKSGTSESKVKLAGIELPENSDRKEAEKAVLEIVKPDDILMIVHTDSGVCLYDEQGDTMVQEYLLLHGYARLTEDTAELPDTEKLKSAQRKAENAHIGIWKEESD